MVNVGDYAAFYSEYVEFGEHLVKAKALDNRVGCCLLIELIKEIKNIDFYGVFTVMEEIGLIGAGPASYKVNPDISVILEGTLCYEMPKLDSHLIPTVINNGPAISLMDKDTLFDIDFRKRIVRIAKENNIDYQYRKTAMGGNDAGKIHTSKEGSITAAISIPCRNIHSPVSIMSKNDYKNTFRLLRAILRKYDREEL